MPLLALPVLWTVHAAAASAFVGPVGPRAGAATGTSPDREPPTAGNGFSREDVRSLLRHRHALVIAGEDVTTALQVAESLADVGASVVVGCLHPEHPRVQRAALKITERCADRIALATAVSQDGGQDGLQVRGPVGGQDGEPQQRVLETVGSGERDSLASWRAGCELRPLDLSTPGCVCRFAEDFLTEGRPLHVIVNCADDVRPFYRRSTAAGKWEVTTGTNHLGPFLLTQLLLDRVVQTMRADAKVAAAERKRQGLPALERVGAGGRDRRRRVPPRSDATGEREILADQADSQTEDLHPRPYPAPLGRVISLGLHARLGQPPRTDPPALQGLYLTSRNYTGWRAYRCAHEANTLASLQLSRMLKAGLSGLYFSDFTTEPAWKKSAAAPLAGYVAKLLYSTSMGLVGAPPAEWKHEAAMVFRGYSARQRQRPAAIRGRRDLEPKPPSRLDGPAPVPMPAGRHQSASK